MKDPRYSTIHGLLKLGHINKFTDIFQYIPYTVLAAEYNTNHPRMKKMTQDPALWTLAEIYHLADLIEYNQKKLALMAVEEVEQMKKGGK